MNEEQLLAQAIEVFERTGKTPVQLEEENKELQQAGSELLDLYEKQEQIFDSLHKALNKKDEKPGEKEYSPVYPITTT
jgi:hypothetical protein